jgi:hypothetical protein
MAQSLSPLVAQGLDDSIMQFFEQYPRLLQILGVESFGEPIVNLRQQFVSFSFLALLLPQASQTRGGAEFEGLGLLSARYFNGRSKTFFCF